MTFVSQRGARFGTNRYTLSLTALSHDHQGLVSITGVRLPPAIQTAQLAVSLKRSGHEPNTPLHHWHHLSCSRVLDKIQPNLILRLLPITSTEKYEDKYNDDKKYINKPVGIIIMMIILIVYVCSVYSVGTLLFDLSDLSHSLLEDGTFVRLDVEAVNVGEVGRDELSQLLDVLALLFPPTLVTPAGAPRGLDMLP